MIWTGYPIYEVVAYPNRLDEDEDENEDVWGDDRSKFWQYYHVYHLQSFHKEIVASTFVWFDAFVRPPRLNRLRPPGE